MEIKEALDKSGNWEWLKAKITRSAHATKLGREHMLEVVDSLQHTFEEAKRLSAFYDLQAQRIMIQRDRALSEIDSIKKPTAEEVEKVKTALDIGGMAYKLMVATTNKTLPTEIPQSIVIAEALAIVEGWRSLC
jgi:hypothetical protein